MRTLAWMYLFAYMVMACVFWAAFFENIWVFIGAVMIAPISTIAAWTITWSYGWYIRNTLMAITVYYLFKKE